MWCSLFADLRKSGDFRLHCVAVRRLWPEQLGPLVAILSQGGVALFFCCLFVCFCRELYYFCVLSVRLAAVVSGAPQSIGRDKFFFPPIQMVFKVHSTHMKTRVQQVRLS